jgi:hypothetical protein
MASAMAVIISSVGSHLFLSKIPFPCKFMPLIRIMLEQSLITSQWKALYRIILLDNENPDAKFH